MGKPQRNRAPRWMVAAAIVGSVGFVVIGGWFGALFVAVLWTSSFIADRLGDCIAARMYPNGAEQERQE
jgi:hypothetical protein